MKRLFIFTKTLLVASLLGVGVNAWATSATGLTSNPMTLSEDVGHTTHYRLTGDATNYYELVATYDCTSSTAPNGGWSKTHDAGGTNLNGFTVKPARYRANKTGDVTDLYALLTITGAGYYYYYPEYGMDCENNFTVKITSHTEGMVLVVSYKNGADGANTADYAEAASKYDYSNESSGLSGLLGGKSSSPRRAYLSFSVYRVYVEGINLKATATHSGMEKTSSSYYPQYTLSAINANTGDAVAATFTATASDDYEIVGNTFTYKSTHAGTVSVTATYEEETDVIEIPACTTGYVLTASYDFTQKSSYISSLVSGEPTNASTQVNGFNDNAPRYQFANSKIMLSDGVYANTNQMLFFVGYGLTNASSFGLQFMNHQDGLLYAYKKKVANGGSYASANTAVDWKTSASATGLDARGTSIYTGLDVYAPTGTTVSIPLPNAYATYASTLTLDFTGADVRYIKDDAGTLKALAVEKAAAQTPLLITKTGEETSITATVVDMSETTTDTDGNLLVGQLSVNGNITLTSASAPENHTYYALGAVDDVPGFYKVGENNVTIAYGKAYLNLETSGSSPARANIVFRDNEITGITDVRKNWKAESDVYYNLNGQRVSHPAKGLYILNGKKVIIK